MTGPPAPEPATHTDGEPDPPSALRLVADGGRGYGSDRRLRVVLDMVETTGPDWGGMQEHVRVLGRYLAAGGCDVWLVMRTHYPAEIRSRIAGGGVRLASRPGLMAAEGVRPALARWAPSLWRLLRRLDPDVYHIHSALTGDEYYAAAVARAAGAPAIVCSYHTLVRPETRRRQLVMRAMHRLLGVRGIVGAAAVRESIQRRYALPPGCLAFVPYGVEDVTPGMAADASTGAVSIGILSRLVREKGIDTFLAAMAQVHSGLPVRAVIVGEGDQLNRLKDLAHAFGLADRVEFRGFVVGAARLLREFDLVVIPSRTEGFPLAAVEACAAGRPIIATRAGGLPEVVQDGENGLLVAVDDTSAMARAIEALVRDPLLRERMGECARRRYDAALRPEIMAEKTVRVYRATLSGARVD